MLPYVIDHISDERARFEVGDAQALTFDDRRFDVVVSGLVLNFIPDPSHGLAEMARVTRPGGVVGAYVWDYAGRVQVIRHFWDAAGALDPSAESQNEGFRFLICKPPALEALFRGAGLVDTRVEGIEIPIIFRRFDDYWLPFLGGAGPAANYVTSLSPTGQDALRESLRQRLPTGSDGSISLVARDWAVRGDLPGS